MSGAQSASSAEPDKLFLYASRGLQLAQDLRVEASRLGGALQRFEAGCSEPGFQIPASGLADLMGSQGSRGESIDNWVRQVGTLFQIADSLVKGNLPAAQQGIAQLQPGRTPSFGSTPIGPDTPADLDAVLSGGAHSLELLSGLIQYAGIPAALMLQYVADGDLVRIRGRELLDGLIGRRDLKELAGVGPTVGKIDPANLPLSMAKKSLKLSWLGVALSVGPQWLRDIRDYRGEGISKLSAALAVDMVLKGGISMLASAGGYWAGGAMIVGGAALLGLTAPAAAIVVGGIVGSIVLGMVGERIFDWLDETGVRKWAIDATQTAFDKAGRTIASVGRTAAGVANQIASTVDSALGSAVSAIQNVRLPSLALDW